MPDAVITLRESESRNAFVTLTPAFGTATINSGTVTLYDNTGAVAGGVSAAALTGSTAGASANPQAWFMLDAFTLGLSPGLFILAFLLHVTAGGVTSTDEPTVMVLVKPDDG